MGFEPTASTLARLRSTPELHPLNVAKRHEVDKRVIEFLNLKSRENLKGILNPNLYQWT